MVYRRRAGTKEGDHYDFACAADKLLLPNLGGASISDANVLELLGLPTPAALRAKEREQKKLSSPLSSTIRGGYLRTQTVKSPAQQLRSTPQRAQQLLTPSSSAATVILQHELDNDEVHDFKSKVEDDVELNEDKLDEDAAEVAVRSDLWCVSVGTPYYKGEQIVSDIATYKKRFKYLPKDCKNCIGILLLYIYL